MKQIHTICELYIQESIFVYKVNKYQTFSILLCFCMGFPNLFLFLFSADHPVL